MSYLKGLSAKLGSGGNDALKTVSKRIKRAAGGMSSPYAGMQAAPVNAMPRKKGGGVSAPSADPKMAKGLPKSMTKHAAGGRAGWLEDKKTSPRLSKVPGVQRTVDKFQPLINKVSALRDKVTKNPAKAERHSLGSYVKNHINKPTGIKATTERMYNAAKGAIKPPKEEKHGLGMMAGFVPGAMQGIRALQNRAKGGSVTEKHSLGRSVGRLTKQIKTAVTGDKRKTTGSSSRPSRGTMIPGEHFENHSFGDAVKGAFNFAKDNQGLLKDAGKAIAKKKRGGGVKKEKHAFGSMTGVMPKLGQNGAGTWKPQYGANIGDDGGIAYPAVQVRGPNGQMMSAAQAAKMKATMPQPNSAQPDPNSAQPQAIKRGGKVKKGRECHGFGDWVKGAANSVGQGFNSFGDSLKKTGEGIGRGLETAGRGAVKGVRSGLNAGGNYLISQGVDTPEKGAAYGAQMGLKLLPKILKKGGEVKRTKHKRGGMSGENVTKSSCLSSLTKKL